MRHRVQGDSLLRHCEQSEAIYLPARSYGDEIASSFEDSLLAMTRAGLLRRVAASAAMGLVLIITSLFFGCSQNQSPTPRMMWQAIYSNPEGDKWLGPKRSTMEAALADAEAYAQSQPLVDVENVLVLVVPEDNTALEEGQVPPNAMARRTLEVPVTVESVSGEWRVDAHFAEEIAAQDHRFVFNKDGMASTTLHTPLWVREGPDTWEVFNDSSFCYQENGGGLWVFSVMQFDGDRMQVYLDGRPNQLLELSRVRDDRWNNGAQL